MHREIDANLVTPNDPTSSNVALILDVLDLPVPWIRVYVGGQWVGVGRAWMRLDAPLAGFYYHCTEGVWFTAPVLPALAVLTRAATHVPKCPC